MGEPVLRRLRGPATSGTVEAVHADLDALWAEAPWVPEADRTAFALAVVEATTNAVRHAVPATDVPVRLGIDITAGSHRLEAVIHEIGAAPSHVDLDPPLPARERESGRGLAMIRALVSRVVVERHGDGNVWRLSRECAGHRP